MSPLFHLPKITNIVHTKSQKQSASPMCVIYFIYLCFLNIDSIDWSNSDFKSIKYRGIISQHSHHQSSVTLSLSSSIPHSSPKVIDMGWLYTFFFFQVHVFQFSYIPHEWNHPTVVPHFLLYLTKYNPAKLAWIVVIVCEAFCSSKSVAKKTCRLILRPSGMSLMVMVWGWSCKELGPVVLLKVVILRKSADLFRVYFSIILI